MMRWLIGVVLVAAALWAGYWFAGSRALERGTASWFQSQQAQGWTASYSDLSVQGFPSRFDMTLTEPHLADPQSGLEWSAPFVQLLTLSYTPWHVILALPPQQRVTWPGDGATIGAEKLQASLVVKPQLSVPLDRFTMVGSDLDLRLDSGLALTMATARAAARRDTMDDSSYELGLDLLDVAPQGSLKDALAPSGLPATIAELRVDAIARLSAPLDRFAADSEPELLAIDLRSASVNWGKMVLTADGSVGPDATGLASGTITLHLTGWEEALQAVTDAGLIAPQMAETIRNAAKAMAAVSAADGRIDLPVSFAEGQMSVGGFPVGPAPRLR